MPRLDERAMLDGVPAPVPTTGGWKWWRWGSAAGPSGDDDANAAIDVEQPVHVPRLIDTDSIERREAPAEVKKAALDRLTATLEAFIALFDAGEPPPLSALRGLFDDELLNIVTTRHSVAATRSSCSRSSRAPVARRIRSPTCSSASTRGIVSTR